MNVEEGIVIQEYGYKWGYGAHKSCFILFRIEDNIFENGVVEIRVLDIGDFNKDEYMRGPWLLKIRVDANFTVTIENGIGAVGSIG